MENMSTLQTVTEKEMDQIAWDLIDTISSKPASAKAFVVFLKGDLGAGKTTFTKAFAKALSIEEEITSPTFVILKRYPITNMGEGFQFTDLIHVDAYRLKSYAELEQIKFSTYLFNPKFLILLEWPEMVESAELKADIFIKFAHTDEGAKKKGVGMIILKVIGFIASILVGVAIVGGVGITCAFGGNAFLCHRVFPVSMGIGAILIIILVISFFGYRKVLQKTYWIIFLIWVLLLGALFTTPKQAQYAYVWGVTKQACESGRPAVPWGWIPEDKNSCYALIDECLSMGTYDSYCFERSKTSQINDISECDRFSLGKAECQKDFAIKANNLDYCKNILPDETRNMDREWNRFSCVNGIVFKNRYIYNELQQVFDREVMEKRASYNDTKAKRDIMFKYCDPMGEMERNVCLYQASIDVFPTHSLCDQISLDWLRSSCVGYQHDKETESQ